MIHGLGYISNTLHVGADLLRHLLKHLFRQVTHPHALLVFYELNNISGAFLSTRVSETATISIKLFHGGEVCITDANNNDGAGQFGQVED